MRQHRYRSITRAFTHIASPVPRADWDSVLGSDPGATPLQTPQYFDAATAATGGRDASRLYVLPDGRRLVLPLIGQRTVPGLRLAAGYPGGYGHGSMLATGGLRCDDVRAVVEDLQTCGLTSVRIDGGHHTAAQWSAGRVAGVVELSRCVNVVDLQGGFDQVWRRFSGRIRTTVAKAERAGVTVEADSTGRLVPLFYEIYLAWVERWVEQSSLPPRLARRRALLEEPRRKFEIVAAMLGGQCRTFIASHGGRPVAASITLVHGQHAIGWRSYSIRELAAPVEANTLTQVRAIEDACRSGCRFFDLGQSGGLPSLEHFKRKLGGVPHPIVDLRVEPPAITQLVMARDRAESTARSFLTRTGSTLR